MERYTFEIVAGLDTRRLYLAAELDRLRFKVRAEHGHEHWMWITPHQLETRGDTISIVGVVHTREGKRTDLEVTANYKPNSDQKGWIEFN